MAKKKFSIGKINIQRTLTRSAVIAATGAAAQILETLVEGEPNATTARNENAEMVDYGMIAAGIVLPEVVKGNEMVVNAADALLAIGAYRMAKSYNLAEKIGVNSIGSSSDVYMIGSQTWKPRSTYAKVKDSKPQPKGANGQAVI